MRKALIALVLVFALSVPAWAEEPEVDWQLRALELQVQVFQLTTRVRQLEEQLTDTYRRRVERESAPAVRQLEEYKQKSIGAE
jgi:hypothetical protein